MNYAKHVSTKQTPQSQPIPGTDQVKNSAGWYSWQVDEWDRLDRFLILGSEGGSYYASEKNLTLENAKAIHKLIQLDGPRVVARVSEISSSGRAPKNDPAIFALALAMKKGDDKTRGLAAAAVPAVCRIGTHLFQFADAVKQLGGWGRNTKGAFADWYLKQTPEQLSMQLAKYQSREGWSHRDILRKAHVKPIHPWQNAMLKWAVGKVTGGTEDAAFVGPVIQAFEQAKIVAKAGVSKKTTHEIVGLISNYNLPRECVPTEFLNELDVWEALLTSGKYGMPMTAMIRNLAKMTEIGLLKTGSSATKFVTKKLRDAEALKAARVHPIAILLALSTYRQGHGLKGSLSWTPVHQINDALDDSFYKAFDFVEPTGKRLMLALDISGSMGMAPYVAGTGLTPRDASAAMAMVTAKTEENYCVVGFTAGPGGYYNGGTELTQINGINAKTDLPSAIQAVSNLPMGGTDCSLPMRYAEKNRVEIDAFQIYTDSETWAGEIHASQALRSYRQKMGIDAKLIVNGMVANNFTIADPNDRGMLDVVGFDANVPVIMADFVR